MGNIFNDDFRDFITALNKHEVRYVLVGGYAVILNNYRRTTGDMDIWVETTAPNFEKLIDAFLHFGLPTTTFTKKDFLENDSLEVFTFGKPPVCIDIMKVVKGCSFDETFDQADIYEEDGLRIRFINFENLVKAKLAAGRNKDLDDVEKMREGRG
jgi:predicted nucleotidyltransferase